MITHNAYENGVQSLKSIDESGQDFSIGIIPEGKYSFGIAEKNEHITITSGRMKVNGTLFSTGATALVEAGQEILIEAAVCTSYICQYR
jgi:uncharacterized protein YaiE (UPF0345 family)